MTNNSHANCTHPATKAARAACRKARDAAPTATAQPTKPAARTATVEIWGGSKLTVEVNEFGILAHPVCFGCGAADPMENDGYSVCCNEGVIGIADN